MTKNIPLRSALTRLDSLIFTVRGERVILDSDLSSIYGVPTKRLNEQVRRNSERFPEDFCFRLSLEEVDAIRSQIATGSKRNVRFLPYAFTEHGAIMAANVLNSKRAVQMSVFVVRAFVKMREVLSTNKVLANKLQGRNQAAHGAATFARTQTQAHRLWTR